jgi:hypothetical protein
VYEEELKLKLRLTPIHIPLSVNKNIMMQPPSGDKPPSSIDAATSTNAL